jgi:hypothetical protein
MKTNPQTEIFRNAKEAASLSELYLLCQAERQQLNTVLAKLLSNHTLRFASVMSNSLINAA